MTPCKIFLVDDHALFRSGLRGLLDRREEYTVVGEAGDGAEFLSMLPTIDADVVFMDISMPRMGGAEATERALEVRPGLRVVTLSMFGDENYYARMVEAGACGFLLKDSDIGEVTAAIEAVMNGENYFSPAVQSSLAGSMRSAATRSSDADALSGREIEILVGVCRGLSNQEIADELFISKRTVDKHRANILEKTGCKNTASLVIYAIRRRLVDLE
ncbi:MAG: response regulator transcription factor [Alistipes sp.]|nr:response regulator transcription factor [Alistipes sp.]